MGQEYLIDSNILIGYLDNKLPKNGTLFMHTVINNIPKISVITKIEILIFNTTETAYKTLEDFINISVVQDLSNDIVDQTIQLCKSRKIKLPDAIIAATAIANDMILITRNVSDFKAIQSLRIIDPFSL
ncbi:PIN domain protein [Pedobacter glucosidilyticus]|nr:type II toxin-antitoxin system VapC family toxin [Pedobacter glucosidilyticus]KHJ36991.1 PIN domain protein [Pedobacter glucosidilyticus]